MADLNIASCWEAVADIRGDDLATQTGDVARTWREFDDRSARLAGALQSVGIGVGENVALALYNGNEYLEAEYAAMKVRAAPCNVNYRYVEAELAYLVDNSDAKAVVFDGSLVDRFDAIRADLPDVRRWIQVGDEPVADWAEGYEDLIAATDPAPRIDRSGDDLWILYTGGTTGHPKGVMWPHSSLMALAGRTLQAAGIEMPTEPAGVAAIADGMAALGATPRQLAASPLMHGTAGLTALMTLTLGGAVVNLEGRSLDSDELWRVVADTGCKTITIVGDVFCAPMVDALDRAADVGDPYDISSVSTVTSSGVMWSQGIKDRLLAHAAAAGTELVCNDALGSSEGVGFAGKQSQGGDDTTTATFTLGPNAAVFTEDGRRVEPGSGERGLLAVTGPIPLGYYGDPVKSAETFREIEGIRWSIPGDWASVEADGTVVLHGRGSVSINTGGEKVYPEEVEEALKLVPGVLDANVVGVPDPKWGSAVTAVVSLADDFALDDAALVDALRKSLAGYKLPKHIVRVEDFVRNPNGKSDYRWAAKTASDAVGTT